eukprot:11667588-Prorocentrum_lima.AAC.1
MRRPPTAHWRAWMPWVSKSLPHVTRAMVILARLWSAGNMAACFAWGRGQEEGRSPGATASL